MADTQTASTSPSGSLPPDMLNPPDSTLISGLQPPTAPAASLPQSYFDPVVANLSPPPTPAPAPAPQPPEAPRIPGTRLLSPTPQPQIHGQGQPLPPSQVPPGANISPGGVTAPPAQQPASSQPTQWRAVGDSIARGYQKFGGAGGTGVDLDPNNRTVDAAGGRPPAVVLDYLKSLPDGAMNGQNIAFSTGVSNDPSQINLVPEQLAQLKRLGATNVKVVGVGDQAGQEGGHQYNLAPYNAQLQKDATDAGYTFGGALPAVVHPAPDYYRRGLTAPQPQGTGKTIDDVTAYIQKAEGGGPFILFGHEGQPYDPNTMPTKQPDAEGPFYGFPDWAGGRGSSGDETHAAGGAQWEPKTWQRAVNGFVQQGLANKLGHTPDFRNPDDQKAVFNYWADRRYRELTGRDIVADMNAGHVDWSALGSEWESLKNGGGGGTVGMTASNLPGYQRWQQLSKDQQSSMQAEVADMQKRMADMQAGSPEQRALADQLLKKQLQLMDKYEEMIAHPPTQKPRDMISNFGSIATLVGIFAGRFANRPMVASLNAAGAAMEAMNNNDRQAYTDAFNQWKVQADMTSNLLGMEANTYKGIMENDRLSMDEKYKQMDVAMKIYQNQQGMMAAEQGDIEKMWGVAQKQQDSYQKWQQQQAQIEEAHAKTSESQTKQQTEATTQAAVDQAVAADDRAFAAAHPDATPDEIAQAHADNVAKRLVQMKPKSASAAGLETGKPFEIVDDKGKVIRQVQLREHKDQAGYVEADSGNPLVLKPGEHVRQITPTTAGGGRAGAQVMRQLVGGREVLSDLQNAVSMPVGTTIGWLGNVNPGPTITGALAGDLTRHLTSQDSQLMQASMASLKRELSTLMSPVYGGNYASEQIDPLIPKEGDTLATALFKLARIAQSADNALEAAGKSPLLSNDEQEYAASMRNDINTAIPWSPAQALAFAYGEHPKESFGDFVGKRGISTMKPDWATGREGTAMRDGKQVPVYEDHSGNWFFGDHSTYKPQ
jgi:hypothetical protein